MEGGRGREKGVIAYWVPYVAQALEMGLVNAVVPLERLEEESLIWARQMLRNSPTALRMIKAALNAAVRTVQHRVQHVLGTSGRTFMCVSSRASMLQGCCATKAGVCAVP